MSVCSSCHQVFKESDLIEFDDLPFCRAHYQQLFNGFPHIIETVTCSPDDPQLSVKMHNKQVSLNKNGVASYLKHSYKQSGDQLLTVIYLVSI